ncbi:MFS transporter [Tianweitania sp. BSSL-BM11]|uniref:MFS transporter n=1 Tax=Tianweitania aestuarii TaxID=2814886 RepID=A0ABS5RSP7_9HYPH|nr:MFS transporter [Tianweitania aestuarii]MBS9720081.1 MFS transporter [Tianweitania aestuarii]
MSTLRPLIPLLIAAGILLGGNGLQATLIAIRGASEGFQPSMIGWMGTAYFAGFFIGCLWITRIMQAVGHVRAFATLAAIASAATLMLILWIDPFVWAGVRFVTGFCFSGLFTVIESWLNQGATNKDRARVLALYRIVDVSSVTGCQFLIPLVGTEGYAIFCIMTMMITLSLVPVSLGDRSNPVAPEEVKLNLRRAWAISPLAAIGCVAVGVTNGSFRTLAPVYAQQLGMSEANIVIFVSAGIIGSVLLQYPLGALSDRWDRRKVLLIVTAVSMIAAFALAFLAGSNVLANFALVFTFGAFAMTLFSLCAAHANDHAEKGEYVLVTAALMLFYSIGAIVGPVAAAYVMQVFGPAALFVFTGMVYAVLIVITLYRMRVRGPVPASRRSRFTALLRTSPLFSRLTRRTRTSSAPLASE